MNEPSFSATNPSESLSSLLHEMGTSLNQLKKDVPFSDEDLVLVTGSVAEGLGTPLSDIDVLVVGPTRGSQNFLITSVINDEIVLRLSSGAEVNITYLDPEGLAALEGALCGLADSQARLGRSMPSDRSTLLTAHRLRTGTPIYGNPDALRLRLGLPQLADHMLVASRSEYLNFREDAEGQLQVGHQDSARFMMSFTFHHVASVVLTSVGETNPDTKWQIRLLQRHRASLNAGEVDQICLYLQGLRSLKTQEDFRSAFDICEASIHRALMRRPHLVDAIGQFEQSMRLVIYKDSRRSATPLPR